MTKLVQFLTIGAALAVGLAIQQPVVAAERGTSPCEFTFAGPGVPYFLNNAVLVGGYANCNLAPETFHISLELMYKPFGGNWVRRAAATDSKMPDPRLNIATWAQCEPGAWKGVATMWVAVNGVTVSSPGAQTMPTIITC
ncbi:hypothetical protein ACIBG0_16070 [Nocardia sp. NPDC050630]|uniref:hypothetical protein n=1 Tax=Nocardia sp. NPDC050630 TaxID=3364321 RepID=UPI0037A8D9CF